MASRRSLEVEEWRAGRQGREIRGGEESRRGRDGGGDAGRGMGVVFGLEKRGSL